MTEGVTQDAFMRAQEDVHQTFLLQFFFPLTGSSLAELTIHATHGLIQVLAQLLSGEIIDRLQP